MGGGGHHLSRQLTWLTYCLISSVTKRSVSRHTHAQTHTVFSSHLVFRETSLNILNIILNNVSGIFSEPSLYNPVGILISQHSVMFVSNSLKIQP